MTSPDQPPSYRTIAYRVAGETARITLDRPERNNVLTDETFAEPLDALDRMDRDDGVHLAILDATGSWTQRSSSSRARSTGRRFGSFGQGIARADDHVLAMRRRLSGDLMDNWLLFLFAVLFLILIPLAPNVVRLRIRFCRWMHWEWRPRCLRTISSVGVCSFAPLSR